ncbi:MAG TPA: FCD domain-containing protein [Caldilineaceae bacterium]|nr:FCD domain-containing protein [Caldilineaceae bacterium]
METLFLSAVDRNTLADRVYQVIIRYIHQSNLQPGTRLPSERRFSELLEVSREVVRGALERLEVEELVERRAGSGVYLLQVPSPMPLSLNLTEMQSTVTLRELYEARIALEVGSMEWIVEQITEQELAELEEVVNRFAERMAAGLPVVREDREFHLLLMKASHNAILLQFSSVVQQFFDQLREFAPRMVINSQPDEGDMAERHRMVIDALRQRDVAKAQQAMRMHFNPLPETI